MLFLFNHTAPTEIYTLSLHDALPISLVIFGGVSEKPQIEALRSGCDLLVATPGRLLDLVEQIATDRKSTRLNSSHEWISYAVFCLKKKKKKIKTNCDEQTIKK